MRQARNGCRPFDVGAARRIPTDGQILVVGYTGGRRPPKRGPVLRPSRGDQCHEGHNTYHGRARWKRNTTYFLHRGAGNSARSRLFSRLWPPDRRLRPRLAAPRCKKWRISQRELCWTGIQPAEANRHGMMIAPWSLHAQGPNRIDGHRQHRGGQRQDRRIVALDAIKSVGQQPPAGQRRRYPDSSTPRRVAAAPRATPGPVSASGPRLAPCGSRSRPCAAPRSTPSHRIAPRMPESAPARRTAL